MYLYYGSVIIFGEGVEKYDGGRGCQAKDDVTSFNMISVEIGKFQVILFEKIGLIISKLSR